MGTMADISISLFLKAQSPLKLCGLFLGIAVELTADLANSERTSLQFTIFELLKRIAY